MNSSMQPTPPMHEDQHRRDALRAQLKGLMPRLWRFGFVLTCSRATADDLVQAACVRVIEARAPLAAGVLLERHLMTSMRSIWENDHRADSVRRRDALLQGLRRRLGGGNARRARADGRRDEPDADTGVVRGADAVIAETLAALESLPQWHRLAVLLVGVESYSLQDAAQVLGMPVDTLIGRLAKARRASRTPETPACGRLAGRQVRPLAQLPLKPRLAD